MKRMICIAVTILLVFAAAGQAQPILTADDLAGAPGTTITISNSVGLVPVNPGSSGANQTWDFSSIQTTLEYEQDWVDPAETPFYGSFPDANRCLSIIDTLGYVYNYYQLTDTQYSALGFGSDMYIVQYDFADPIITFPVEYLDEWSSVFSYEIYPGTSIYDSTYTSVDAWGTVIDGSNTYENCLRMKSHHTVITYLMGVPLVTVTFWTYSWESVGYGPVATVTSQNDEPNPNFDTGYFSRTLDITGVLESPSRTSPVSYELKPAFPNPFNPETRITFDLPAGENVVLSVFDIQGREVSRLFDGWLPAGRYQSTFSGDGLAGGVYIARLTAGKVQQVQKLILVK